MSRVCLLQGTLSTAIPFDAGGELVDMLWWFFVPNWSPEPVEVQA